MDPIFTLPSFTLRWKPLHAEMMISGVVGYTRGSFERRRLNKDGAYTLQTGTYTTVWMKQPGGLWKAVLDTGNPDGTPQVIEPLKK
jgi:ketosteroid isomerase-like protein